MRDVLAHIGTFALVLAVFLGGPMAAHVDVSSLFSPGTDVTSSATVIMDAPSGHYTILINRDLHTNDEVLGNWEAFFRGEDVPLIMEDVSCVVLAGDASGLDMATSLQSRLAENQMTVREEQATLALSKAEAGVFDVIVMSDEAAASYQADDLYGLSNVVVVTR